MCDVLKSRSILIGITGSVAAYKSIELIKRLRQEEASVNVIMTKASHSFITPLSIEIASGSRVRYDMFEEPLSHISLAARSDLFVVAPATANIIGKYANGIADDLLSTAMLAFNGQPQHMIFAPAMNWRMWENLAVQRNIQYLSYRGITIVDPEKGSLACGEEGIGRMADVEKILFAAKKALTKQDLSGQKVLVTAGPTREYIDPIRYISNRSSGKMGYAVAKIAKMRGADVTLISGPVSIDVPYNVKIINVETANEMYNAVMDNIRSSSIFVMAAAVADFTPASAQKSKIEKGEMPTLNLAKTEDILEKVSSIKKSRPYIVGFSAETGRRLDRARKKLIHKNIDMIVFNDVLKEGSGFDVDTNEVVILDKNKTGSIHELPLKLMSKDDAAMSIFDRIMEIRNRN